MGGGLCFYFLHFFFNNALADKTPIVTPWTVSSCVFWGRQSHVPGCHRWLRVKVCLHGWPRLDRRQPIRLPHVWERQCQPGLVQQRGRTGAQAEEPTTELDQAQEEAKKQPGKLSRLKTCIWRGRRRRIGYNFVFNTTRNFFFKYGAVKLHNFGWKHNFKIPFVYVLLFLSMEIIDSSLLSFFSVRVWRSIAYKAYVFFQLSISFIVSTFW